MVSSQGEDLRGWKLETQEKWGGHDHGSIVSCEPRSKNNPIVSLAAEVSIEGSASLDRELGGK